MKRKLLSILLAASLVMGNTTLAFAEESIVVRQAGSDALIKIDKPENTQKLTPEEQTKVNNASNYRKTKEAKMKLKLESATNSITTMGAYSSNYLRYDRYNSPERQSKDYYCGPAAILNAVDCRSYHSTGKNTPYGQSTMASMLRTDNLGYTNFDYLLKDTLNVYAPGNNYLLKYGNEYNSSDWNNTVIDAVIWTIDKGYPVVFDTLQNPTVGFFDSAYSARWNSYTDKRDITHFITVYGYQYSSGTYYFNYFDSASYHHGTFTVDSYTLARTAKFFGVVW